MELTVRAINVGLGNTKLVSVVTHTATGTEVRRGSFPSTAYPSPNGNRSWPGMEWRKTVLIPRAIDSIEGVGTAALADIRPVRPNSRFRPSTSHSLASLRRARPSNGLHAHEASRRPAGSNVPRPQGSRLDRFRRVAPNC